MSFTIPVMTRKIGIESTISQMIPPKNILINTGSPQHTAAIITAPKELFWYAETHSVMAHNDKSAWKANPNKMPRYFKNNTGWSICWESTIQDIFSNPFKPYIIQHKTKLTNTNHMKMKIVNVKEAKILALNFAIPFLSSDEYQAISTIEIQLKNISNDMQKLHEKEHYLHYKDIYEILLYNNPILDNPFYSYQYENRLTQLYDIASEVAYEICMSVIIHNININYIKNQLQLFDDIETENV